MGLLTKNKCAQCGGDLGDDPVERQNKKFCSDDCAEQFEDEHGEGDHNTEEDKDVCQFC
jgi:hypothetical protein